MILNHVMLAFFWIFYCVLHSVLAASRWKANLRQKFPGFRWYRVIYTVLSLILLIALVWFQLGLASIHLFRPGVAVLTAGVIIGITGLALMLICIKKYFMSLSGLRTLAVETYSNELQVNGIHQYVRHPLYLGTFAFIWGLFFLFPLLSLLISNMVITVYTLIGIQLEERKLVEEFGENYNTYRQRVPMLLPSIKRKRKQ